MFPSCPLDKSCITPDNCSSGRNNASRFPIGITSLRDENQQIRIQSAVHKYNNSANNSLNSKCAVTSPVRNFFLKNSLKAKNYEADAEGMSKNEKKNGNQYEGVGAFPTIHLRKSAVRYRPIRKFNDVKIPYPELPVNRFLSSSSEICPDLKSSTRSVLDVLEDLSGKKIHIKENNGNNKPKSKGLGGDYVLNPDAVYKPLFVQKPKISSVLTRDNTTQTLTPLCTESPSSQCSNSFLKSGVPDPRAELRRKLAKQNNEIFASLSSSIASTFTLKRKIEKVLFDREDENLTNGSATKKSKISDQPKNYNENGVSNSLNWSKTNSINSVKLNKKSKRKETNSPTSPNKDRLTTIFLDMQSNNAESQIFHSISSIPTETESVENSQKLIINGLKSKVASPVVNGSSGNKTVEIAKDESALKNSPNLSLTEKITVVESKNQENGQSSNPMFNFLISKAETTPIDKLKSTSATLQYDINASNIPKFSFPKTSEVNQIKNGSPLNGAQQNTSNGNNLEKKDNDNTFLNKSLTSGSSSDKSNFNSFKFGTEKYVSPELSVSQKDPKTLTSETLSESTPLSSNSTLQFSFGTTTNETTFASQTSTVKFGAANAHDSSTSPVKASFSFGHNTLSSQQSCETNKIEEKDKISNGEFSSSAVTTQSIQSGVFNFPQKSSMDSPTKTIARQNIASTTSPTSQSNAISFSPTSNSLTTNASSAVENSKSEFTFGHETEPPATSTTRVNATQEQKFSFSFGQKSGIDQNKTLELCEPKNSNLFSFGQKSTTQESTESISLPSQNLPVSSQPIPIFGHNLPVPAASTAPVTFAQTSPAQISNAFGAKSEAQALTNITGTTFSKNNTSFPIKSPVFGSSASDFGNATTQASIGFGTSTSNASGFGFGASATTRPTATFGVSSASQIAPGFGTSATSQPKSEFGTSSTTQSTSAFEASPSDSTFKVSTTTQAASTFGVSTTPSKSSFGEKSVPQSIYTFGISSTSQPTSSFGVSSTAQPASMFGTSTSHSAACFGAPCTQSTHTFGTTAGFKVSSSSQPSSTFGVPTSSPIAVKFGPTTTQTNSSFGTSPGFSIASSTQPNTSFGTPVVTSTSIFGTTQPSFSQTFGNKSTSSLGQTANIFEQNAAPSFSSSNAFNSNQNNVFVPKPAAEGRMFEQNKTQTSTFSSATQPFATQSKFSFGMCTSNVTGFTTSPPTTTAPTFSFGGSTTQNTFTFGSNTPGSNNSFAFKSPASEPFKFGTTTTKEGSGFGGTNTATFTFGGGQMNNNSTTESKPTFNFGSTQVSSSAPFNFRTVPSPVFSFGGSSAGSGSNFSFGTPNPTAGVSFGQTSTPSPAAPFAVPGTFCIGSGSSQSRPRATSRPRRRP